MPKTFFNPDASLVAHRYKVYVRETTGPLKTNPEDLTPLISRPATGHEPTSCAPQQLISIVISSFLIFLVYPSGLFPCPFPTSVIYAFPPPSPLNTCAAHRNLKVFSAFTRLSDAYSITISCNFLYSDTVFIPFISCACVYIQGAIL